VPLPLCAIGQHVDSDAEPFIDKMAQRDEAPQHPGGVPGMGSGRSNREVRQYELHNAEKGQQQPGAAGVARGSKRRHCGHSGPRRQRGEGRSREQDDCRSQLEIELSGAEEVKPS
jgi:hypothetical protein